MMRFRKRYAPGWCSYRSGYEEIRWDVVGCNLRCQFCWSPASRPRKTGEPSVDKSALEVLHGSLQSLTEQFKTFIRFTGGEPTLYWDEIVDVLNILRDDPVLGRVPVLIQTNGLEIGSGRVSLDGLASRGEQDLLFELSFKGTNRDEFLLLTTKDPELYDHQLNAYELLADAARESAKLRVIAVLGVYHSAVKGPSKYVFVNPKSGVVLFDDYAAWDPRFRQIWLSARAKWVEPLRMSPKGMWDSLYRRCGPEGSGILRYYPERLRTNPHQMFPMKPGSSEYARLIVERQFWF